METCGGGAEISGLAPSTPATTIPIPTSSPRNPTSSGLRLLVVELHHVGIGAVGAEQVLGEVLGAQPEPVVAHAAVAVPCAREDEEVEALVGLDERLGHAEGAGVVDVVVDVAGGESTVLAAILRAQATSLTLNPPKTRSSTTWACRALRLARLCSASSRDNSSTVRG